VVTNRDESFLSASRVPAVQSRDAYPRPGGALLSVAHPLLARLEAYLADLDIAAATLRRLLAEARAAGNLQAEAAIATRLHQHAHGVLELLGDQALKPRQKADLSRYTPETRELLIEALCRAADEERTWEQPE
jgi:hypothetical protein